MLTFTHLRKGQGEACILNFKTNAHSFASISKLKSGGLFRIAISRYLASYLYYPIVTCCEIHKQSSFQ